MIIFAYHMTASTTCTLSGVSHVKPWWCRAVTHERFTSFPLVLISLMKLRLQQNKNERTRTKAVMKHTHAFISEVKNKMKNVQQRQNLIRTNLVLWEVAMEESGGDPIISALAVWMGVNGKKVSASQQNISADSRYKSDSEYEHISINNKSLIRAPTNLNIIQLHILHLNTNYNNSTT